MRYVNGLLSVSIFLAIIGHSQSKPLAVTEVLDHTFPGMIVVWRRWLETHVSVVCAKKPGEVKLAFVHQNTCATAISLPVDYYALKYSDYRMELHYNSIILPTISYQQSVEYVD